MYVAALVLINLQVSVVDLLTEGKYTVGTDVECLPLSIMLAV